MKPMLFMEEADIGNAAIAENAQIVHYTGRASTGGMASAASDMGQRPDERSQQQGACSSPEGELLGMET
jgi:hypothetical protein